MLYLVLFIFNILQTEFNETFHLNIFFILNFYVWSDKFRLTSLVISFQLHTILAIFTESAL